MTFYKRNRNNQTHLTSHDTEHVTGASRGKTCNMREKRPVPGAGKQPSHLSQVRTNLVFLLINQIGF